MGGSPSLAASEYGAPKLMLLTVADPPKIPCELWVDVADLLYHPSMAGFNLTMALWMAFICSFKKSMMTCEGVASLRTLSSKYNAVGVWGHNGRDPDDWETFHWLVKEGRQRDLCQYRLAQGL